WPQKARRPRGAGDKSEGDPRGQRRLSREIRRALAGRYRADATTLGLADEPPPHTRVVALVGHEQRRVPLLPGSASLEGRLREVQDGLPGIAAATDVLIKKDELAQVGVPARGRWPQSCLLDSRRRGKRVREQRGLAQLAVARPEPDADLLRIATHPPDDAGIGWGRQRSSGVTR